MVDLKNLPKLSIGHEFQIIQSRTDNGRITSIKKSALNEYVCDTC